VDLRGGDEKLKNHFALLHCFEDFIVMTRRKLRIERIRLSRSSMNSIFNLIPTLFAERLLPLSFFLFTLSREGFILIPRRINFA
jgi:hypothetical protein